MTSTRDQLLKISSRFLEWTNSPNADPTELKSIVAEDVLLKIPYPGQTADHAGLIGRQQSARLAAPDFKLTLLQSIVDETESTVVQFLELSGTHQGFLSRLCTLNF
jgi:hypothetical protein